MSLIFLGILGLYYLLVQRPSRSGPEILSKILIYLYLALGASALLAELLDATRAIYAPNYLSAVFLAICILVTISGFRGFKTVYISQVISGLRGQHIIENILIATQLAATLFFLPVAVSNFSSDIAAARTDLTIVTDQLTIYGFLNTFAGAACQLFATSLIFMFIRLAQPAHHGKWLRVSLLLASSLSYVIYILAYIGRDGVIYWAMTVLALFVIFRPHLPERVRAYTIAAIQIVVAVLMVPFSIITVARFGESEMVYGGFFEYFGTQIQNFSDYSTIVRPRTNGLQNFPIFYDWTCEATSRACERWEDVRGAIFGVYLDQGKEPWLFGTFVSDFVADFGYIGTVVILAGFAVICRLLCWVPRNGVMSASRLLLIIFLFLVPYWGVFYFRFGISNGFIVVNFAFVFFVWMLDKVLRPARVPALG
jgi:hypothetical protein